MNEKAQTLLAAFADLPLGAVVVEIGCVRFWNEVASDGYSTVHLAMAAKEYGWDFYSVDYDAESVAVASEVVGDLPAQIFHADGATWLAQFHHPIDGLYLDGSLNPAETLAQYHAATLADGAVIAVDDVNPTAGKVRGKGDLVLDALETDGFTVEICSTVGAYEMAVATR